MEIGHLVALFTAALTAIAVMGKWFIKDYAKKIATIEQLKAANLQRLSDDVTKVDVSMRTMRANISAHGAQLKVSTKSIQDVVTKIADFEKQIDYHERTMKDVVKQEVGYQLRTEIVKITDQLVMVKGSKN